MKMNLKKQRGIAVITLVLLVVTLLAVIGAMVQGSRTTASSTSDQTAKVMATALIDQANMQRIGFDLMVAKGTSIDSITFNAVQPNPLINVGSGLFNVKDGTAVIQTPPAGATSDPTQTWAYARGGLVAAAGDMVPLAGIQNVAASGVLGTNSVSYGIVLNKVKDSVCKQFNAALLGYDPAYAIPLVRPAAPAINVAVLSGTLPATLVSATADASVNSVSPTGANAGFDISDLTIAAPNGYNQGTNLVKDGLGNTVTALRGSAVCVKPGSGTVYVATGVDNNVIVNIIKFMQ